MKCESQPQERLLERYRRNTGRGAPKETVLGNRKAEADAEPAEGCHCPAARPVLFASPSHRRRNKVTGNHPAKGLSGGSQAWTRAAWLLRAFEKERARVRGREGRLSPRGTRCGHGGQHVTNATWCGGLKWFASVSKFLTGVSPRDSGTRNRNSPNSSYSAFLWHLTCFKIIMSNH